jgi:hypothetical protein
LPLGGDHQKFDFIVKLSKFLVPIIAVAVVLHMPKAHAVLATDHDHASLDRVNLWGREGHCACALRKTDDEGRDTRGATHRHRQG